jgi:hypothetical protein
MPPIIIAATNAGRGPPGSRAAGPGHHPLGEADHLGAVAVFHGRDLGVEVQVVHDYAGQRVGVVERHVQLGAAALPLGERAARRRVGLERLGAEAGVEVVDDGTDQACPRPEVAVDQPDRGVGPLRDRVDLQRAGALDQLLAGGLNEPRPAGGAAGRGRNVRDRQNELTFPRGRVTRTP